MNKIERNKRNIERFKDCINTNDKILADELIDSSAEFASLISPEKLYGGAGYLKVVDFMRKSFSDIHWDETFTGRLCGVSEALQGFSHLLGSFCNLSSGSNVFGIFRRVSEKP